MEGRKQDEGGGYRVIGAKEGQVINDDGRWQHQREGSCKTSGKQQASCPQIGPHFHALQIGRMNQSTFGAVTFLI